MPKYLLTALLSTAILACGSAVANAQTAQAYKGAFYVSIFGGLADQRETEFNYAPTAKIKTTFDSGYAAGAALGYNLGQLSPTGGVRAEFEFSYRKSDVEDHSLNGGPALAGPTGEVETTAFMLNGYYDVLLGRVVPYIGAGIGAANVNFKEFGVAAIPNVLDDDETVLAYQGIAGVRYGLTDALSLGVEYRYFATSDVDVTSAVGTSSKANYETHNGLVNLTYNF